MRSGTGLLPLLLFFGCASAPPAPPAACGDGIAGEAQVSASLVVMGEIHGTREIPAAFAGLVCRAAAGAPGRTTLVGLEILTDAQPAIDAFLASDGGAAATRDFLAAGFWQREYQDGRSSRAMLDLLAELRRQRAAGLGIAVRALDPPAFEKSGDRDAGMSANLAAAIDALHPARTLVLVGNVHSRTLPGYPWDPKADYQPLGMLLRARYPDLVALNVSTLGGLAWICTSAVAAECSAKSIGIREPDGGVHPRIELDPPALEKTGHHGRVFLGTMSASEPARLTGR
jgi:hypothetical protein